MSLKIPIALFVLSLIVVGCGSSEPAHPEKPLTAPPAQTTDFSKFTAEQKIEYIQNSKAPEAEKQKAIDQIKAGKL